MKTTTVTPPATTLDLVYGLHSSKQCIALHGVVETDGTAKFCKFEGNTAITGWSMYKHWTTTRTHTCTPYSYQTCEQSYWWCCNTGAHTFNNKIPERCTYNLQNNAVGGPGTQATCNSIVTERGYY